MSFKEFKVRFYRVNVYSADDIEPLDAAGMFSKLQSTSTGGLCATVHDQLQGFEVRDLRAHNSGTVYQGVFATIRDDAPHIREALGGERVIPLQQDEGILEKNHFLYYRDQSVLVYQVNQRASHPTRFEFYLSTLAGAGHSVSLDDMLTRDAWEKLNNGIVKEFDVTFDAPRDPNAYDPADFTSENLRVIERSGAGSMRVVLKASRGRQGLLEWVKHTLHQLKQDRQVRKLQVKLDGETTPIDLFADVIREKITVAMDGRYPNSQRTFEALEAAKQRAQAAIDAHFGY